MVMKIIYKDGQACPIVICDYCEAEITDALKATYAYVMGIGKYPDTIYPEESEIFHVHNGQCFIRFERMKEIQEQIWLGTIPLQCLPIYLATNLGVNWLKAYKDSQLMSGFSLDLTPRLNKGQWQELRLLVLERDGNRCQYCGRPAQEVDHVIPISRHGTNELTNLVASCKPCNRNKRAKSVEEWLHI